jgi:hypothetical protein
MALPNYKDIVDLIKKGANLEAQEKILELREAALELQEENISLREEIKSIKDKMELTRSMVFEGGVYYIDKDGELTGPFCPGCHDSNQKLVRMHPFTPAHNVPKWLCKVCNTLYDKNA